MALRSVVVQPPAPSGGARRTVVLRPGGPKPKGGLIDVSMAILGALLLLGSVVLVNFLPDTDYVNPRYKLFFPAGSGEMKESQTFAFVEGTSANSNIFVVDIPNDNIVSISVRISFIDDMPASLPDMFRFQIYDPLGNPVGDAQLIANPPPTRAGAPQQQGTYTAYRANPSYVVTINPQPQEEIIETAHPKERTGEALNRLEPTFHLATKGVWSVKVELMNAGDCPNDTGNPPDPWVAFQAAACARPTTFPGTPSTADLGNPFILEGVTWSYFATCVEVLMGDSKPLPSCR